MNDRMRCRNCGVQVEGRQASLGLCRRCEQVALKRGEICESCKRPLDGGYPCAFCGKTESQRWHPMGVALLVLLAMVGASGLYLVFAAVGGVRAGLDREPSHNSIGAFVACQAAAEQRLRSPATAEWPSSRASNIEHLGSGRYRVRTHVDAQNAFGAMIRSNVDCAVRFTTQRSWVLDSITMRDRQ